MALITKGLKLSYKTGSGSTYTDLTNLLDVPELGGSKDKIEVTTLADSAHVYINGIENYGDSIDFNFIYDKTQFATLDALDGIVDWKVTLPDGDSSASPVVAATTCTFSGECSVKLSASAVNAAMQYTLSITPSTDMVFL